MALIGADYNRPHKSIKLTQFSYWVMMIADRGGDIKFSTFTEGELPKSNKCEQGDRGWDLNSGHFVRT